MTKDGAATDLAIHFGDCIDVIPQFQPQSFHLIYIDPPFNTGRVQSRDRLKTTQDADGDRTGYQGKRYRTEKMGESGFNDKFDDFIAYMRPRIEAGYHLLAPTGSFFFHIDYREAHYCKIMLDEIFGRDCFMNEIIWAYDYGARAKRKWSAKHDSIFWYVKNPKNYTYRYDDIDRIPYMAPGLVGPEKAKRGKTPTDVWWQTIVPPNSKERTGYATQKPIAILNRIVRVHSNPGDRVLDYFAGSGTTGEAAIRLGRHATLVDSKPEAIDVMISRLAFAHPAVYGRTTNPAHDSRSRSPVAGELFIGTEA